MPVETRLKRFYGWKRELGDKRDFLRRTKFRIAELPPAASVRSQFPPILDQGDLGSCTANAIANAHFFDQRKQGSLSSFLPSRLFIYYNERKMEGSIGYDSGAQIRDGIKSIARLGVCPEIQWPYEVDAFRIQPPVDCYVEAKKHQAILYERVPQTLPDIQDAVASGFPVVIGFSVYESFESEHVARTGDAPLPNLKRESLLGGHCVALVGYDDATRKFTLANSWGSVNGIDGGWGDYGYFTLPYAYLTDPQLSSDFWVIRLVET